MRYRLEHFFPTESGSYNTYFNTSEYMINIIEEHIYNNEFEELKKYSGWHHRDRHHRDYISPLRIFYCAVKIYFVKANFTNNFTTDNDIMGTGFYRARRVEAEKYEPMLMEDYDTFRDCLFNKLKDYGKSIDTLLNDDRILNAIPERDLTILIRFGATESIKKILDQAIQYNIEHLSAAIVAQDDELAERICFDDKMQALDKRSKFDLFHKACSNNCMKFVEKLLQNNYHEELSPHEIVGSLVAPATYMPHIKYLWDNEEIRKLIMNMDADKKTCADYLTPAGYPNNFKRQADIIDSVLDQGQYQDQKTLEYFLNSPGIKQYIKDNIYLLNTVLRIETPYDINIYHEFAVHFMKKYGFDGLKEENERRIQHHEALIRENEIHLHHMENGISLLETKTPKRFHELDKLFELGLSQLNHLNDDVLGIIRSFGLFVPNKQTQSSDDAVKEQSTSILAPQV